MFITGKHSQPINTHAVTLMPACVLFSLGSFPQFLQTSVLAFKPYFW